MACNLTLGRKEPCKDVVGGIKNIYIVNYGGIVPVYDGTDTGLLKCIVQQDTYKPTIDIEVEGKYKTLKYEELSDIDFLSPGRFKWLYTCSYCTGISTC